MTLRITVNGESVALPAGKGGAECATIAVLLEARGVDSRRRGVAVALNGAVVARSQWARTRLAPSDRVEVVRAVAGG